MFDEEEVYVFKQGVYEIIQRGTLFHLMKAGEEDEWLATLTNFWGAVAYLENEFLPLPPPL